MGADYIEQDVVMPKDGVPVVMHDIYLDDMTDVAEKFPGRMRRSWSCIPSVCRQPAEVGAVREHALGIK